MKPIPKSLLIHFATLSKKTTDNWGNNKLSAPVQLSHIRIEPSHSLITTKDNNREQLKATLIYDCRNSFPRGIDFNIDDVVAFNDIQYQVNFVEPYYDGAKIHHYEIGMV